jgi:hypothetical protein
MTRVPRTILPKFATAMEMSQFFLARHQGDVEAAAQDMESVLRSNRRLYKAMVNDFVRLALEEKACRYFAGLGRERHQ